MIYNWQQPDWTKFTFDKAVIEDLISQFTEMIGVSKGLSKGLSVINREQALVDVLVIEAIKNSEIEGEFLSRKDVVSSIKNNLGLVEKKNSVKDFNAKGMATVVAQLHEHYNAPLTEEILFNWHKEIFPKNPRINAGIWRSHKSPMQVVSGTIGKEVVHFEAPPSKNVTKEMDQFITWFNCSAPMGKNEIKSAAIRASIAHLYFETIHPFEDGNGRIGRLIAEKALYQTLKYPVLMSLSAAIESNKNEYYKALKSAQRNNEITQWLVYFIGTINMALTNSTNLISFTLQKAKLFDGFRNDFNERELKVVKRILKEGSEGFIGGISAKKYMRIAKTSKATATRDLKHLCELGVLISLKGGGRSAAYVICFPD